MFLAALQALTPFATQAASGGFKDPSPAVVVVTGLVLVFFILILLTVILTLEGKIFAALDRRKQDKQTSAVPVAPPPAKAAPAKPVQAPAAAPAVEAGIPAEVVAAIAAAVNEMEGGKYVLRSVKMQPKGRGQWGMAGVIAYTEPF